MKTTQAWAWLAAGVLALGLNGFYHDGGAEWAHRIVDRVASRSAATLALVSGRGDLFLVKAQTAAARQETQSCRLAATISRFQTRMSRTAGVARFEVMSARQEAALAPIESDRARSEAVRVRFATAEFDPIKYVVACPRMLVSAPRIVIPSVNVAAPAVRADLSDGDTL